MLDVCEKFWSLEAELHNITDEFSIELLTSMQLLCQIER